MRVSRLLVCVLLCSVVFAFSCNKKDSSSPTYTVEYKINTQDLSNFVTITYVDSSGVQQNGLVTGATTFVKTITVKNTPFTAQMGVKVTSETTHEIDYDLVISVNGAVKKLVSGVTAPFSSTTTTAEFVIN